jgi:7-cyano-7-deazaguanine reductase
MEKKILTYKDIDASLLKSLPNPSGEAYEIKIKIPEFTFLGVKSNLILRMCS